MPVISPSETEPEPATRAELRVSRRVQLNRRRAVAIGVVVAIVALVVWWSAPRDDDARTVTSSSTQAPTEEGNRGSGSEPASQAAPASVCDDAAVTEALASDDDVAVIAAVGGGEAFRAAVAGGDAPCVSLSDPSRVWTVVNKQNALDPIDYWPEPQAQAEGVRVLSGSGWLDADAAAALSELSAAIEADGLGPVGVNSAFRSYDYQVGLYDTHVTTYGAEAADLRGARAGYSEHQTGFAVDLVSCADGCTELDEFGATAEADWVAENAWRFGFIIRYDEGETGVTGYIHEPWHLRYVGTDLARVYHEGGYRTLEDFFGLPAAADYAD